MPKGVAPGGSAIGEEGNSAKLPPLTAKALTAFFYPFRISS
jgi:hypothetical protein